MNARQIVLTLCVVVLPAGARAQQETRNPHGKLKEECAACHGPQSWVPARVSTFDHAKKGLPLLGAHASAGCRSCHVSLKFVGARTECTSCHQDTHRGELGLDCARCHTPRSFHDQTVMARAHQTTRFPLSGAHGAVACTSCHKPTPAGQLAYASTSVQCVNCHRTQYIAAKSPDHVAGGFPEGCLQCHTPTTWTSARFNHNGSSFPLTGAHRTATCQQCHGDGVYNGKNTACVSCHQADYDATTNPIHASTGFPTTCQTCHTTTGWTGASLNHTWFPQRHGNARQCSDCHTTPTNYSMFTCTSCHTKSRTDSDHRGENGYVYNSQNCYACHPRGSH